MQEVKPTSEDKFTFYKEVALNCGPDAALFHGCVAHAVPYVDDGLFSRANLEAFSTKKADKHIKALVKHGFLTTIGDAYRVADFRQMASVEIPVELLCKVGCVAKASILMVLGDQMLTHPANAVTPFGTPLYFRNTMPIYHELDYFKSADLLKAINALEAEGKLYKQPWSLVDEFPYHKICIGLPYYRFTARNVRATFLDYGGTDYSIAARDVFAKLAMECCPHLIPTT